MLFIDWCDIEENKERGEKLLKEIRLVDTKGKKYKLEQITHGSHLKMLWECEECNHQWYATVYGRIDGRNCPECYNKNRSEFVRKTKTNSENSLSTWCLNNERGKQIKSEWTGLCEDDKHYTMDEVSYGSKLKMLWRDEFGHEWWDTINKRTYGRDCPYYNNQTSYAEQYIYWSLKQLYPETQNRCVVLQSPKYPQGIEYDIIVPDIPLAIEYSATAWHKGKEERDNLKKEICNKCNICLIQIIDDSYKEYKEEFTENYICIPALTPSNRDDYLLKIVSYILDSIGHSIDEIDIDLVKKNALDYSKKKIEYEKSLAYVHPELAKEMDNGMNNIKSTEITPGSAIKIKFLCPNCQYGEHGEWLASPHRRTAKGYESGCPRCHYNWYKEETGQPQNIKSQYRNLHKVTIDKEYDLRRALNNPVIKYEGEYDF